MRLPVVGPQAVSLDSSGTIHSPRSAQPQADRTIIARLTRPLARAVLAVCSAASLLAAAPSIAAAQVDLVLNVTDTPDPSPATGVVTYNVVIENNGLTTATGVTYTMTLPANTTYNGFTAGTGASCSGMAVGANGPGTITCTHPNLAFTVQAIFSIRLKLNIQGVTTISSMASSAFGDSDPFNNTVANQTTVVAGADFGVTVSAPATLPSGSTFSYVLSVDNVGPDAATALRVQMPVPTGFTVTGSLPAGCSISGGTLTCDVAGPIASGATFVIGNITGKITVGSISNVTATATVGLQPGAPLNTAADPSSTNNTSISTIAVTAGSDVRLTIARSTAGPYFVGNAFNFVLTAAYDGDSPSGLTMSSTIPSNYTIGSVVASQNGWSCGVVGQTVTCTRASGGVAGNNQALGSVTIPVTIATAGVNVATSASISASAPTDPTLSNNSANDGGATLQTPTADLALSKSGPNPALVVVGVPFEWAFTVSNGGPFPFSGQLVLTDNLPAGVTVTGITLNGWSCSPPVAGPATITCTRTVTSGAPLASGGSVPTPLFVATATATGAIINNAVLSSTGANAADPNLGNNSQNSTVTSSTNPNAADLLVNKTVDLASVNAGDVLTYTIEVVNVGPTTATNITLTDDFPTLITTGVGPTGQGYISETVSLVGQASGVTCGNTLVGGVRRLTCTIPSLPVCTAGTDCPRIQVAVRPGGDGGTRSNTAYAVSSTVADPNTNNNSVTVNSTIVPRADVTVTKSDAPDPATAGQDLVYTVAAVNNGPSQAFNVTITDVLPLNVYVVSVTPQSGTCSVTPTLGTVTINGNRTVVCNLGTISNQAQRTVVIIVRPTTVTRGTTLTNNVDVTTTSTEPAVPGNSNNSAVATTFVSNPNLDLLVNKTETIDPVTVGTNTVYTIVISNVGPSDAQNIVVTDVLPSAGLSFQSLTISSGSCPTQPAVNAVGGNILCNIPRINAGGANNVTLLVTMQGVTKGAYTNSVSVASDETVNFDTDLGNNTSTQVTTVRTRADIQVVSKTPSVGTIAVRRPYTWTIRVRTNTGVGLSETDSVRVTDNLPAGTELTGTPTMAIVSGTISENSCTGIAGQTSFVCTLGTQSNGGEVDITVPVRTLNLPSGGVSTNTATAATSSFDVISNNNSASGNITVTASSVSGLVFRDFNNNTASDVGDTGIGSVVMTLTGTAFDAASITRTATTDAGLFTVSDVPEGTYTLQRGTVSESFLTVGTQTAGTSAGVATVVPNITGITLGATVAATNYLFAFIPQARLGLAKRVVGTPTVNGDGSLTALLRIKAQNYSLETLNAVAITDPLNGAAPRFGTYIAGGAAAALTAGSYTINAAPSVFGACATATPTAGFDGSTTTQLAQIGALAVSGVCEFDVTLRYRPTVPLPVGNYLNQATGTGTGALSGQTPSDQSHDGTNPDPDNDQNPGNNTTPTPLNGVLAADVTTVVTLPAVVQAGGTVSGTIRYENLGPYTATGVVYTLQATPNLTGMTFGNLPTGVIATYAPSTGVVTLAGMPTSLTAGQIASGNGTTPITIGYTQNPIAVSTVLSVISTTSNEGANIGPNSSSATVTGNLIADVTTSLTFPVNGVPGATVNGTVLFRNNGPSIASSVTYALTMTAGLTGVTFGNVPAGAALSYAAGTGVVTLTGMPTSLAVGEIASLNGSTGITLVYNQVGTGSNTINSVIGTSTNQGANVAPDNATAVIVGIPVADVQTVVTFPPLAAPGQPVSGTVRFSNTGPTTAFGVTYSLTLAPTLVGVTFGNLPTGATATYNPLNGTVTFTGMPSTLVTGAVASGNGTTGITVQYEQNGIANSTITGIITTTSFQGANTAPDTGEATVLGTLVADVTTAFSGFPANVLTGGVVSGTVVFRNGGPSTASGVTYALTMSRALAGVTFSNLPIGSSASYNPTTGVVTFSGLPTSLSVREIVSRDGVTGIGISYLQIPVRSDLASVITTTTNQGANVLPDNAAVSISASQPADLAVVKTASATEVSAGDTVVFTIRAVNNGPLPLSSGSVLRDEPVPTSGFTLLSAQCAAVALNTCTQPPSASQLLSGVEMPELPVGRAYEILVTALVSASNGQFITNAARVSVPPGFFDPIPENNVSVVGPMPVRNAPDLALTKTASGTFAAGGTVSYLLTVRNVGTATTTGATSIVDVLPAGLTFVSASGANFTCSASGQTVTCTTPDLFAPGATATVTIAAVLGNSVSGSTTNTATVTTPGDRRPPNNTGTVTTLITTGPDLVTVKSLDTDSLRRGSTATYTLSVRNIGTRATTAFTEVSDVLPIGLIPTAASGPEFACTISGQQVTCRRTSPLAVGQTVTINIAVRVTATLPMTPVKNTACARTDGELNPANDCGDVTTPVAERREATLRKDAVGDFVAGGSGTYRLWLRNSGGVPLPGPFTITDTLPRGITFESSTGASSSCAVANGVVRCIIPGSLAVGDSTAVTLVTSVALGVPAEVTNCATVTGAGGIASTSCVTVQPRRSPDLRTIKRSVNDTLRVGGTGTYTITIDNIGAAPTTAPITMTDVLPVGVVPTSVTGTRFACTINGQTVECVRTVPMIVGDVVVITITTMVSATGPVAALANTACTRTAGDLTVTNDCSTISTPVAGRREAVLRKEASGEYIVGEPGTFRLWVRNSGTVALPAPVTVIDTLPRGLTYASARGDRWSCSANGAVVTCNSTGTLAVGDSTLVTLLATVLPAAVPEVTNCANLIVTGGAILGANGRSCVTVRPRTDYRLVIDLTTPRYELELGDVADFTVVVRNTGRSPLPAVDLTNLLPRGFSYVPGTSRRVLPSNSSVPTSIADPSGASTASITWPIGDMLPGAVTRIAYRAVIRNGASFDGDNVTTSTAVSVPTGVRVTSNTAQVPIRIRRGVFDTRGVITGKVYVQCDCDSLPGQGSGEVGIPGVRVLLEDGTAAITDVEGKYNILNVRAGLHVVKIDRTTLPAGARLIELNVRNAGDGGSRFVDLKAGELHRADFADGSRSDGVMREVLARRRTGEVSAAGDSARMVAALSMPMTMTETTPGRGGAMVPAPQPTVPVVGSTYTPLAAAGALHNGNSALPASPLRARAQQQGSTSPGRARVQIEVPTTAIPADGRGMIPVTVRLTDSTGAPARGSTAVTLEASAGGWRVFDGDGTAMGSQVVISDGVGVFQLVASADPMAAKLRASTATTSATRDVTFVPVPRPLMATGLIQGRLDVRRLSKGALGIGAADDAFETPLLDLSVDQDSGRVRLGARGALLLKGDVKRAGLLTLAYDTERDPEKTQFRNITPDIGFPIAGDASLREFDAQSQQRLYLRLDRGTSYVRYGDFATPRSDERRLLLAYDRSLTGLTHHAEGTRGVINSFVSQNRIRQVIDELPGRGLSGPYFLSRPTAVINSERVEVITRDRNQPAVILKTQSMTRFEDYTIEPGSGRLLFRAPVASLDGNFNPVTIRVSYEVETGGGSFFTYGTDGTARVGSRLELGAFAMRDENPLDKQMMLGAAATAVLGDSTTLIGELARTQTGTADLTGSAWRLELRHQSSRFEGRVFALHSDTSFANRSSTFLGGRTELGARWNTTINSRTRLIAEALRSEDTRTTGRRDGALLSLERRFTDRLVGELGYRWADENGARVSPFTGITTGGLLSTERTDVTSGLTPLSFSAARARLALRAPKGGKSMVFGEYELGLDDSNARRGSVGGEYLLFNRARLYLRHEWLSTQQGPYALGEGRNQQNTVFGVDADYLRNSKMFSEYRARDAFNGRDAEASVGLRNRWALGPGILANTSFERVSPLSGATTGEAYAATGAMEWTRAATWKSTARLEWRTSPTGDNLLGSFGYARKLTRDWTMLTRSLWDQSNTIALRGRSQLALTWRETDRNRINALFRLENRLDRTNATGEPTQRTTANIAAALVNMQYSPRLSLSTRYAAKLADDLRDGRTTSSSAHLLMARTVYDLSTRTDIGLIGSVMGSGGFSQRRYGLGAEVGRVVLRNLRLAGGYNVFGFTDRDFESMGYTKRGPYIEFGFKFDEALFGNSQSKGRTP